MKHRKQTSEGRDATRRHAREHPCFTRFCALAGMSPAHAWACRNSLLDHDEIVVGRNRRDVISSDLAALQANVSGGLGELLAKHPLLAAAVDGAGLGRPVD